MEEIRGRIHSEESAGTVDGPGLRYVVFTQGCPLRCQYCHNPDTWGLNGGKLITPQDLIDRIVKYKDFMKFSNGGVTVSGGEPLIQPKFVTELFKGLKAEGIHTAVDTAGHIDFSKDIEEVLKYTDLVLLDIKHLDPIRCKELTGFDNLRTLRFLDKLEDMRIKTWIRYVIVPTFNDTVEYAEKLADYVKKYKTVELVELLPYHEMGKFKWENLGLKYRLQGIEPPSKETVKAIAKIFNAKGIKTLGGGI
ncbi:MAG: pyruvate formate-lyase-activating protein [Alphaproteobacteria bacterium]|nr:pyruvate formate-lyase-activating protein [Alphaproteobacteria bacterium]